MDVIFPSQPEGKPGKEVKEETKGKKAEKDDKGGTKKGGKSYSLVTAGTSSLKRLHQINYKHIHVGVQGL